MSNIRQETKLKKTMNNRHVLEYYQFLSEQLDNSFLLEGINIDTVNKIVSIDLSHEEGVDTSLINPTYKKISGVNVISIFKRVRKNDPLTGTSLDGNPLIYALKEINGWKINKDDIIKLLKQFIRISEKIKLEYDTIIKVPSTSVLNTEFLYRINKIIKCKDVISDMFNKMDATDVFDVIDSSLVPPADFKLIDTFIYKIK